MDAHLDRRLRLVTEPEHKGLYSWAINEIDERGRVVGRDQIPWGWSLYFTATEIVLSDQLSVKEDGLIEGLLEQKAEISHRQSIRAKLRPGSRRHDDHWLRETTYKMFGTDRTIKDFKLDIYPLHAEHERENCQAWGSVSYTADVDFRQETNPDCVVFSLMVKPSTFDRYAARISTGTADEVVLSVGMVAGFYGEWSPSVSTRDVKVLTNFGEQELQLPPGLGFEPPRLGAVGEAELSINAKRVGAMTGVRHEADPDESNAAPLVRQEVADTARNVVPDPQATSVLKQIRLVLWVIAVLALAMVVVLFWGPPVKAAQQHSAATGACDPHYISETCVPIASDVDCLPGNGNGPAYVRGPFNYFGDDIYDLDRDQNGIACEPRPGS